MELPDRDLLAKGILLAGAAHFAVLIASAMVPVRLDWKKALAALPRLQRQMHWVYGGYVVLAIVAFGLISVANARELASGTRLARSFCAFVAVFWAVRLALQAVFDVRPYLTAWWLRAGYILLGFVFTAFVLLYGYAASGWAN